MNQSYGFITSFFDDYSYYQDMSDFKAGMEVLRQYALAKGIGFQTFVDSLKALENSGKIKNLEAGINGIGLGVKLAEMSETQVKDAMAKLARQGDYDNIPTNISAFRAALTGTATDPKYMKLKDIKEITQATAVDLAEKTKDYEKIGRKVLGSAANLAPYLTTGLIVVGGLIGGGYLLSQINKVRGR